MQGMQTGRVIREVEQRCKRDHLRLTPTRRRVLELVLEAQGPVKAYDLLDRLKSEQPSAAPPTIYRALEFLLEHHFIHRLETMNAFVSCFHPEDRHQGQFLICERCGHVTEVAEGALSDELERVARDADFSPTRRVLEVYGTCSQCRCAPQAADR
jgi:Fur family zinc uptake transcriptional regulator